MWPQKASMLFFLALSDLAWTKLFFFFKLKKMVEQMASNGWSHVRKRPK